MAEWGRYIAIVWPLGNVERAATYEVTGKDAAHAARSALDGYTGLLGDPDQSGLAIQVTPVAEKAPDA